MVGVCARGDNVAERSDVICLYYYAEPPTWWTEIICSAYVIAAIIFYYRQLSYLSNEENVNSNYWKWGPLTRQVHAATGPPKNVYHIFFVKLFSLCLKTTKI
jgi:hypothetical protein